MIDSPRFILLTLFFREISQAVIFRVRVIGYRATQARPSKETKKNTKNSIMWYSVTTHSFEPTISCGPLGAQPMSLLPTLVE